MCGSAIQARKGNDDLRAFLGGNLIEQKDRFAFAVAAEAQQV